MQKETVIANIRTTFDYSEEYCQWSKGILNNQVKKDYFLWSLSEEGKPFLRKFKQTWDEELISVSQSEIRHYFKGLGLEDELMPVVKVTEHYEGSWVIDACIVMGTTIGGAYTIMKGISEIPDIVEGLTKLKGMLKETFSKKLNEKVKNILSNYSNQANQANQANQNETVLIIPENVFDIKEFTIDARPLSALKPSEMKSHKIHISVGISQETFILENLGEDTLHNLEIGLFKSQSKKNHWPFGDAFRSSVGILSSNQTISKNNDDFRDNSGNKFIINDSELPLHVDCWIQDQYGIYLFNFYIDN